MRVNTKEYNGHSSESEQVLKGHTWIQLGCKLAQWPAQPKADDTKFHLTDITMLQDIKMVSCFLCRKWLHIFVNVQQTSTLLKWFGVDLTHDYNLSILISLPALQESNILDLLFKWRTESISSKSDVLPCKQRLFSWWMCHSEIMFRIQFYSHINFQEKKKKQWTLVIRSYYKKSIDLHYMMEK
jgi:hypothetical protein